MLRIDLIRLVLIAIVPRFLGQFAKVQIGFVVSDIVDDTSWCVCSPLLAGADSGCRAAGGPVAPQPFGTPSDPQSVGFAVEALPIPVLVSAGSDGRAWGYLQPGRPRRASWLGTPEVSRAGSVPASHGRGFPIAE